MEELLAKTKEEISSGEELAGTVAVGGGELLVTSVFVSLIRKFQKEHPHVFFDYQTGVTDRVTEWMDMGLIDAAVLVRPFDSVKYDSVPIGPDARWGVIMRADDPLAEKESIRKEDLLGKTVILPGRLELNAEIANWLGSVRKTITSPIKWDLGGSRVILAEDPGCYVITTEGAATLFDERRLSFLPLEPERKIETVIAWKKDQPFGRAAEAFIRFLQKEAAEKGL
ncbi:MAG TPA: substrate-binding domain-containing protein [Veillonellaceae bacterium]|nr:substrate-binding domain-containing protein [Veillonellaceae bacterium]